MSQFDWPITPKKKKKKELSRFLKIKGSILKYRVLCPFAYLYIGERGTTFAKAYMGKK
jgi:hypothetical protein